MSPLNLNFSRYFRNFSSKMPWALRYSMSSLSKWKFWM